MLLHFTLPQEQLAAAVYIMRKISINDVDFSRAMISLLDQMQTLSSGNFENEEENPSIGIQVKSLEVLACVLENLKDKLNENDVIYGILNELVIPGVQSQEKVIIRLGLQCLGLSCLLDKTMTMDNIPLFLHSITYGDEDLQICGLRIMFDLIMTHGADLLNCDDGQSLSIMAVLKHTLLSVTTKNVLTVAVEGISKLMLMKLIDDQELLLALVSAYFKSDNVGNLRLRQCLSYFLPVYCYSSVINQSKLSKIVVGVIEQVIIPSLYDEELISPLQILQQLADWCDSARLVMKTRDYNSSSEDQTVQTSCHVQIALDLIKFGFRCNASTRKVICQALNKLSISVNSTGRGAIQTLKLLTENIKEIVTDTISLGALRRFMTKLNQIDEEELPLDNENVEEVRFLLKGLDLSSNDIKFPQRGGTQDSGHVSDISSEESEDNSSEED